MIKLKDLLREGMSKQEVMNFKMQSYPDDRNLDKFTFFWNNRN